MIKAMFSSLGQRLLRFIRNNFFTIILSLFISIVIWFIVSIAIYPTTIATISDIPLQTLDITGTPAEKAGLSVVTPTFPETVTVRIEGKRVEIGNLSSENMSARLIVPDTITAAGEYELKIIVTSKDGISFNTSDISPSSFKVEFDEITTREVPVSVDISNLNIADGFAYIESDVKVSPDTVTIKGPKSRVSSATEVVVRFDGKDEELRAAKSFSSEDFVVKSDSLELDMASNRLEVSDDSFTIEIPVMREKALDVKINYLGMPSSFSPDSLDRVRSISASSISFASPDDSIDNCTDFTLEIDVRNISPENYVFEFDVDTVAKKLNYGNYTNISGIKKITVSYELETFAEKTFYNLKNFTLRNTPPEFEVKIVSDSVTLTFVGSEELFKGENAVTQEDISLVVDLSQATVSKGKFTASVSVSVPGFDGVWVTSTPTITLSAAEKNP